MARKLRLEYEDAVYHVISRGNYRGDVFAQDRTRQAFVQCLGEACEKSGWVLLAWCVMSNHYHLCVQTPQPNLVEGMRWLQATFSLRFNRYRGERGHLFQGRYKALLVEPGSEGAVCHYIHLNPVRAGVVKTSALKDGRWTSLSWLMNKRLRPGWYSPEAALSHAGGLKDTPAGRARYITYLGWLQENEPERKRLLFDRMSRGWVIGGRDFKKKMIKTHKQFSAALERREAGPRELSEQLWEERIGNLLATLGKNKAAIEAEPKGAAWKVVIADAMKATTTASNPWLARRLNMGSPWRLSRLVTHCRANPKAYDRWKKASAKRKV